MTDHARTPTVDRRSALKLLATAVGSAGLGRALTFSRTAHAGDPVPGIDITIEIEGAPNIGEAVESLVLEDVIFFHGGNESPAIDALRRSPAAGSLGLARDRLNSMTVRVTAGTPGAEELRAWVESCDARRVTARLTFPDGGQRRFNLLDCFPTAFATAGLDSRSTVACETVVCKISRIEMA